MITNSVQLDNLGLNSIQSHVLLRELTQVGDAGFRQRYQNPFLILLDAPSSNSDWIDLNTSESSIPHTSLKMRPTTDLRVLPMIKSDRNAYSSKITVGRAKNNDIIIRAAKISKLHCSFFRSDDGVWMITDMGSLNGTQVGGSRLEPKEQRPLKPGDDIAFWRYLFRFQDCDGLFQSLLGQL